MSGVEAALVRATASNDFTFACEDLTARWKKDGQGPDVMRPILRFMETHGDLDYGMPGPLVHYLETFFGRGYEAALLESVRRHPTLHTLWMVNRVVNGIFDSEAKTDFIGALELAAENEAVEQSVRAKAADFLEIQS